GRPARMIAAKIKSMMPLASIQPHRPESSRLCSSANMIEATPSIRLLAVQVLDGVGGGLFEALLPLVLADIMGGTGHYSVARGVVGTVQGIGGSSSQVLAGYIVTTAGYNAPFLTLAMVATAGLLLIIIAMPETTPSSK